MWENSPFFLEISMSLIVLYADMSSATKKILSYFYIGSIPSLYENFLQ